MAKVVRFHEVGGPEVLRYEDAIVGDPGTGQVRLKHGAVALNFADTYFRTGLYPAPLPAGIGSDASGTVTAVGEGVTAFKVGDRVTYTGAHNTLGAYSTERLIDAAALIRLPDGITFETASAITMRGLTAAYLMRRIYEFKGGETILLHAAAGGVGLLVSQWAKLQGLTVIGTVSSEAKAAVARAHGCDHTINYSHEDVAARVREITGGEGGGTGAQTYTIEKGDTLSAISKRFYGKAKFWRQIFEANRDTIEDPDRIFPGQTIKLPAIDVDCDGDLDDPTGG